MAAQPGGGGMGILAVIMVSSGVALLVLGRHKLPHLTIQSNSSPSSPALSNSGENLAKKKKKKRVHFAEELVECFGEKEDDDREEREESMRADCSVEERHPVREKKIIEGKNIPANRIALYNGMLRYRMNQASLYR